MKATRLNLEVEQDADFIKSLKWLDNRKRPVNLTGYTALMHVRPAAGSPTLLLELSTLNGRIILGGTAGTITLRMTAAETAKLTFTEGVYDLKLIAPAGSFEDRFIQGRFTVSPAVTVSARP